MTEPPTDINAPASLEASTRPPRFSWKLLLVVLVIGPCFAFLVFAAPDVTDRIDPFAGRQFDRDLWNELHGSEEPNNPRGKMVGDLRSRHLEAGMSREAVEELLGKPDWATYEYVWQYNLGMYSGYRIDYDSLDIHFDDDGRLSHIEIVQH